MAIESIGASSSANVVQPSQQPRQQVDQIQPAIATNTSDNRVNEQVRESQSISAEQLEAAIDRLNEIAASSQRSLNFSVDNSADQVVVQVRDLTTDQVVRQIPNEEALRLAESFDRLLGLIFDEEA